MPIYEYTCAECGGRFDLMRRLAERDEPAACPECGSRKARRELARILAPISAQGSSPCGGRGSGSFG